MRRQSSPMAPRRLFLRQTAAAVLLSAGASRSVLANSDADVNGDSWQAVGEKTAVADAEAAAKAEVPVEEGSALPLERELRLVNDHTGERLEIVYATRGMLIDESLGAIAHLMRDHRANKQHPIDTDLLDQLFQIQRALNVDEPLHVLSGYRTPETNAALRKRSNGVARYSLHMDGKAADIHVPGVKTRDLQAVALDLAAGGVGYYGRSGFVHVDTGRVRRWGG